MALFEEYLTNEYGGGQYFTPEEDELFKERTFDSLKKLEELGWRVEHEQPSFSGILYRLWNNGRSRVLYLNEKKLFKGKATIGKLVAAQNRLKMLRSRGAPKEEIIQHSNMLAAISKELRKNEEYRELFEEEDYYYTTQRLNKHQDPQRTVSYKTLNDAYDAHGLQGLKKGNTEIWYMKQEFFREFNMGWKFLVRQGTMETLQKKVPDETHVLLGKVREYRPSKIFQLMQGETWSPYGEARDLITKKRLHHTSMSVGDIIVVKRKIFFVDMSGFKELSQ